MSAAFSQRVHTLPKGYLKLPTVFGFGQLCGWGVSRLPSCRLPILSYYHTAVLPRIRAATIYTLPPQRTQGARRSSITFRRNANQFQGVRTNLITTVQTVTVVQTVTSPTQTLFTTTCAQAVDPITPPTITDTVTITPPETSTPTPTPTPTPTSRYVVTPVTLTSTITSTDPSGNVFTSIFAIVSTPSPESAQSGSDGGGPNIPVIIGGVVGGIVGLLALIGIIWFIMSKKLLGGHGGHWDDTWEGDQGDQAGAAEVKQGGPAAANNGSSPNPYVYGVVGRGGDQPSGVHSHSRSTSTTGYAGHARSNSETPLISPLISPLHSPPNSPPSLQQHPLPGLDRRGTPVWASASAQQGYFHQGHPPISSDPNFTPTMTSTYTATSRATSATASLLSGYLPPPHTAANSTVAYPPGAAAPIIGGPRSPYNEYHKPPLEQSQHGAARQPSQRQQTGPSGSTTNPIRRTSLISVSRGAPRTLNDRPIVSCLATRVIECILVFSRVL